MLNETRSLENLAVKTETKSWLRDQSGLETLTSPIQRRSSTGANSVLGTDPGLGTGDRVPVRVDAAFAEAARDRSAGDASPVEVVGRDLKQSTVGGGGDAAGR